jgi:hypothetical protein
MANPADLSTIARVLARVGGCEPVVAGHLLTAVSKQIQNFISYNIAAQSYSVAFNGNGMARRMLPDYPVTAVASVTVDGISIPQANTPTASGFLFDDRGVYLRGYTFSRGVQNVAISYTAGYATVPEDIEEACLELVALTFDRLDRPADLSMIKAGDTAFQFQNGMVMSGNRILAPLPPSVYALLQPYARVFPA